MSQLSPPDYMTQGSALVTPEHVRSVFHRYCQYMCDADVESIVALYAPDAVVEDPVGDHLCQGHEAIRDFYRFGFDWAGGPIRMELDGEIRVTKTAGACAMVATCDKLEQPIRIETLDVFTFNAQGLATSMRAYHGEVNRHPV